jgi:SET domain-containing protein
MLLVKTKVDRSPIHGLGLYAVEPIRRGTEVWRFTPGFDLDLDLACLDELPRDQQEWLRHYGYVDPRLGRFILCCDDARYINHSDTPNIASDFGQELHGVDVAVRDIEAGEEITIDYDVVEGARP